MTPPPRDRRAALRLAAATAFANWLPTMASRRRRLAEQADPLRRPVRARRQLGDRRPLDRGRARQAARPERLRRQQAGRRRQRRDGRGRLAPTTSTPLILGHIGTLAVNPFIFDKLPYDPIKDFKPISLLAKVPSLYVVHPDVPAKNLKEFVALAKAKPGQLNYGSAGNGSAGHLAFEYLKMATGIFVVHVPYRGTGPQLTDLLAGRLQAASVGAPAILQFIKAGKLRCIATGTSQRIAQLPDVPTVAEQGWPGFEMTQWYGLLAPASLAPANADKLAAAARARCASRPRSSA